MLSDVAPQKWGAISFVSLPKLLAAPLVWRFRQ
jgi:hypothetical protein